MAYSTNHGYHPQFRSPAVVDHRKPNSSSQMSTATYTSSASQIGRLRSYLVEHDLHSNQRSTFNGDGEMLAPEIRDPFPYIPWFREFLDEKSRVICKGEMENLSDLLDKVHRWFLNECRKLDLGIQVKSILHILNYIHTQKHIIVESMVGKPNLVHYLSMLSILLSKYLSLHITRARPLVKRMAYILVDNDGNIVPENSEEIDTRRREAERQYWDQARSWMSCIAFQNDFSVDRICNTLLNEVLGQAPSEILGELIIGLIEQCIVRYHNVGSGWMKDKELTFFTFVRTMLVFKRFIKWYSKTMLKHGGGCRRLSEDTINDLNVKCVQKRVDFCKRHIVPPRHLKESLQIISDEFPDNWFHPPPYESRQIMSYMLEKEYSTSFVFEDLTPMLCDIHILRLLGRLPRDIDPQFPYLAPQSAEPRRWNGQNLVESEKANFSSKEEERLTLYRLSLLGSCCVPSTGAGAAATGENPLSVQSADSDSSHKISSTTAVDVTEIGTLYRGAVDKEMANVILPNLSNANLHLSAMNMDQCVVFFPTENSKCYAPVCVMDSPPVRSGGKKKTAVNMKRGVGVVRHKQGVSEFSDTSADEEGLGVGHHLLGPSKSVSLDHRVIVENKVVQGGAGNFSMKTRAGGKGSLVKQGGKRKGPDRTGEVGPTDTKQRRTSTSLPTSTPTKSVIVRADSCKAPHGGPGGEGAGPLLGTEEPEIGYPFMDPVWDSNFFDSGQGEPERDDLVPLTAVEGNGNREQGRAAQVLGVERFTNHHEHSNPPGSGSPLFQHEADTRTGSAHVGGPLLNNTQPEVITQPSLPQAVQTKAVPTAPGPGGVGKRMENHTYYPSYDSDQDLLCDDYLRQIDNSFSNQKKLDDYQEMSDDAKSTRSGKPGENHKTSRRGRKPAGNTAVAQNHIPPTQPPSQPRSTRRNNQRTSHATDSSAASSPSHHPPLPIRSSKEWAKQVKNNHQGPGLTASELMTKLKEAAATNQSTNQKPNQQPISSEQQQQTTMLSSVGPNPKKKKMGRPSNKDKAAAAAMKSLAEQLRLPRKEDKKPGPGRRRKNKLDEATPVDSKFRNNEILEHLQRKLTSPEPNQDNRSRRKASEDETVKQSVLPAPNLEILASVVNEVNLKAKRQ